jgi:hypothetical protein
MALGQPQAQIRNAISAAQQAVAAEPEVADQATLKHAISLLERVFAKNAREGASPAAANPGGGGSYAAIAAKHTTPK